MKASKTTCNVLRQRMQGALIFVEDDLLIKITIGNMSYDATTGEIKIQCKAQAETEAGGDPQRAKWNRWCLEGAYMEGWMPEHFGQTFMGNGTTMTITGVNTRARKSPIEFAD